MLLYSIFYWLEGIVKEFYVAWLPAAGDWHAVQQLLCAAVCLLF
jgi:hypothetical protein